MKRTLVLWAALGVAYVALETVWRGHSHPSMLVVGGLCGILVGMINQIPGFYRAPILLQSVIGAVIVLAVEFVSGCILNLWLGWNVWDYTGVPGNILGQVCPQYAILWLALMPAAIWAEDTARWLFWLWEKVTDPEDKTRQPAISPYTLKSIYVDFFTGR